MEAPELREQEAVEATPLRPVLRKDSVALALFWLLALAYGYFVPFMVNWNTESHLYTSFSIVDRGSLNIDPYQQGNGDKSYWHGHYYSDKAPGLSLLAVPLYGAIRLVAGNVRGEGYKLYKHRPGYVYVALHTIYIRYAITYLLVVLPSAALAVLLWLFLAHVTGRPGWSLLVSAVYALGTIAYAYSIWFFSHQITAVLLFCAFLALFMGVRNQPPGNRALLFSALAGLLAGYSVISEYPTAVIACLLGAYALTVAVDRPRAGLAFLAGMLPPAALGVTYNMLAFGRPLATGYLYVHSAWYQSHAHGGFLGLTDPAGYGVQAPTLDSFWQITLGPYRGLFFVSPVLLLFFAGLVYMWKLRALRRELWLCVAVVLVYLVVDASRGVDQNGWSGGWSVASRHLTPMIPFMVVPIGFGFVSRTFRYLFVALGALSAAVMLMTVSTIGLYTNTDRNPIFDSVLPHFLSGRIATNWVLNWGNAIGLQGFASLIPLFALGLALAGRLVWLLHQGGSRLTLPEEPAMEAGTG